ncbi:MAG: glycosyltransferase [Rhodocyclales bacterium]|nr:glycosyltransferase [Rhodocyclales bacterium]
MRFAFVMTNLAGGGAEKAVLKLADRLVKRGHQAQIALLENRIEHAAPAAVDVAVVPGTFGRGWFGKRLLARRLAAHLRRSGAPDLVVSTLPFADEVASLAGLPRHWCRIANTLSAELAKLDATSSAKARRRRERYRRLYGARPLIAVSGGVAADLRDGLGLAGRIETIPNPFDFAAIRRAAAEPCARPQGPYVVHVGRFAPQKRHDLLLDAWARVDTGHTLVLLTAAESRLQSMIAARGLASRVHVAGFQANPYPWIAGADLLVLCSDHEGLPNVLIEALACGTPALSTDCPSGPREILAACPDCLVPCSDAPALAAAIDRCLAAPPDLARVDLAAYDADAVAAAYERLAEER